jgi:hypothetical protein
LSEGSLLVAVRPLFSVTSFSFVEDGKVVGEMERSLLRVDRAFLFWLCSLMWRRQPDWLIQIT